jgi:hypothetical protein
VIVKGPMYRGANFPLSPKIRIPRSGNTFNTPRYLSEMITNVDVCLHRPSVYIGWLLAFPESSSLAYQLSRASGPNTWFSPTSCQLSGHSCPYKASNGDIRTLSWKLLLYENSVYIKLLSKCVDRLECMS